METIDYQEELIQLLGVDTYEVWKSLRAFVEKYYDMEVLWNTKGKKWQYECKYRRGGKTLCGLYANPQEMGFMIIFGKQEREKVEALRNELQEATLAFYDEATTYRDGKWVMFTITDTRLFDDLLRLLQCKRRPNRK